MGLFTKNKDFTSAEYKDVIGIITQQAAIVSRMDTEVKELQTQVASLRGLVNRKLGGSSSTSEPSMQDDELKALRDFVGQMGYTGAR